MDIFAGVSPIETLLAFIVYVGSFAAIPLLAKAFAGALNKLTGLVGDKTKGVFDRPRRYMEKRADNIKANQDLRKASRRGVRGQLRQSLPKHLKQISPRRFLAGGSLRQSAVGRRSQRQSKLGQYLDNRREIADLVHESAVAEPYQKLAEQGKAALSGAGFEQWMTVAKDDSEALHRRQAAIVHLAEAGAIPQLRELVDHAAATSAEKDKTLHIAFRNAVKTGAFYKEAITKKAPDLTTISFDTEDKHGKARIQIKAISDAARLKTTGNIAAKDSTDMDISTWRVGFGLKPRKIKGTPEVIQLGSTNADTNALRQAMLSKVKRLMDPENKLGQQAVTDQQRELFEKVLREAGKYSPRGGGNMHPGGGAYQKPPKKKDERKDEDNNMHPGGGAYR